MDRSLLVVIKGAGEVASGVAHVLFKEGMRVVMTEIPKPTTERRTVAFSEAVYSGEVEVGGVMAKRVGEEEIFETLDKAKIPIVVDPRGEIIDKLHPDVVVDGIMAKRNVGTKITDAKAVIGLGPGFTAGKDVHAVVETLKGPSLGRVIYEGKAQPSTGIPYNISGYTSERALKAPVDGVVKPIKRIGEPIKADDVVAMVDNKPVRAGISGTLRGMVKDGLQVSRGQKLGDIDPRGISEFTIDDRVLTIAGGVLEATHSLLQRHGAVEEHQHHLEE